MGDLLGHDYSLVEKNVHYRVHDRIVTHNRELFSHPTNKWKDFFGAKFEVLLTPFPSFHSRLRV